MPPERSGGSEPLSSEVVQKLAVHHRAKHTQAYDTTDSTIDG